MLNKPIIRGFLEENIAFFKFFDFSVWSQILIFWFWKFYFEKFEVKFHEKFGYREKVCHPCEKTKNFFELFSICFFWSNLKSTVVVFLDFFGRKTFFFTFLGEKHFSLLFWEKNIFLYFFGRKTIFLYFFGRKTIRPLFNPGVVVSTLPGGSLLKLTVTT